MDTPSSFTAGAIIASRPRSTLDQYFVPYQFNVRPCLRTTAGAVPIVITDGGEEGNTNVADAKGAFVGLPRPLAERAQRALERSFEATPVSDRFAVVAFSSPRIDDADAVDALVIHCAHELKADILKIDAEDLADEEEGGFGPVLSSALVDLFLLETRKPSGRTTSPDAQRQGGEPHSYEEQVSITIPPKLLAKYNSTYENKVFTSAVTHLRDLIGTRSPESRPSRRRLLYLRNFAATSHILAPFLDALHAAVEACEMPVVTVAGLWPVTQLRETSKKPRLTRVKENHAGTPIDFLRDALGYMEHGSGMIKVSIGAEGSKRSPRVESADDFLSAFSDLSSLRSYVVRNFTPQHKSLCIAYDGLSSLSDIFQAGMMQHYGVRRLSSTGSDCDPDAPNSSPNSTPFEFTDVLPISAERHGRDLGGVRAIARVATQVARWNMKRLAFALRDLGIHPRPCAVSASEWAAPEGGSAIVRKLATEMSQNDLDILARDVRDSLQSTTPTYADLLASIRHLDTALGAIKSQVSALKQGDEHPDRVVETAIATLAEEGRLEKDSIKLLKTLVVDPATISTRYADVCVSSFVMDALRSSIESAQRYGASGGILGTESTAGFLLFGPPGTGKTMLCRAIAKECGVRFIHVRPSDVHSHYSGISEKTLRCIFELARSLRGCIMFFDEIDSLFAARGGSGNSERFFRSILTEFLQEMDGLVTAAANKSANVIVIGATNRPYDVDDAVLRRLPQRLFVGLPGTSARERIIRSYLQDSQTDESLNITALAKRTNYYSGSDLKHVVRLAAEIATREARSLPSETPVASPPTGSAPTPAVVIHLRHFELALERIKASCLANLSALRRVQDFERRKENTSIGSLMNVWRHIVQTGREKRGGPRLRD